MYYPALLRRLGGRPWLVTPAVFVLGMPQHYNTRHSTSTRDILYNGLHDCKSQFHPYSFSLELKPTDPNVLQIGYVIALDALEITCLSCQPRGWPLAPLPMLLAGDTLGLLMLVCSRDWYGLWYWHGPFYSLAREIGTALFVTLP